LPTVEAEGRFSCFQKEAKEPSDCVRIKGKKTTKMLENTGFELGFML